MSCSSDVVVQSPSAPTVTMLGVEPPNFMMGTATTGLAQETTGTWKATDGATARANYTVTAVVTGTTFMASSPIVNVAALPDTDNPQTVYFAVSLRCDENVHQSKDSTATVQITVTSAATQLSTTHTFTATTSQDFDRS